MVVGWPGDRTERCASPAQRYDLELEKADNKWFFGILALFRSKEKWYNIDMTAKDLNLPNDISELQEMIVELYKNKIHNEAKINYLQDQLILLKGQNFGQKSERWVPDPELRSLFDDEKMPEAPAEEESEAVEVKSHKRRKSPGRRPLPDHLPRRQVIHDIPESEKVCACGCKLEEVGQDKSEELEYVPAEFIVVEHIRPKYACRGCEGVESNGKTVKVAPLPEKLIPKSICTAGLLATIITSKFVDAMPFYRQEKQFARRGIDLSRTLMCNWTLAVWEKYRVIEEIFREELLKFPLVHADETPFQVLREEGRKVKQKSYMWLFCGGPPGKGIVCYKYAPSRSGDVAQEYLGGYQGYVVTDGYKGYDYLDDMEGVTHAACWAHVRRKFYDLIKISGTKNPNKKAIKAVNLIKELYKVESQAREENLSPTQLLELRKEKSAELIEKFEAFVQDNAPKVLPQSYLGKAILYSARQLPRLKHVLKDGIVPLDNNRVENAVRPFAIGRKNWQCVSRRRIHDVESEAA
jgi:transposase